MCGDGGAAAGGNGFMNCASGKLCLTSPEQSKLVVWIKSAMPHPASEEMIPAGKPDARDGCIFLRVRSENPLDYLHGAVTHLLIRIQAEDPIPGRLRDR